MPGGDGAALVVGDTTVGGGLVDAGGPPEFDVVGDGGGRGGATEVGLVDCVSPSEVDGTACVVEGPGALVGPATTAPRDVVGRETGGTAPVARSLTFCSPPSVSTNDRPATSSTNATAANANAPLGLEFVTANDLSKLYAPLTRSGRMRSFYWNPDPGERALIASGLFPSLPADDLTELTKHFSDQPISFLADIASHHLTLVLGAEIDANDFPTVLANVRLGEYDDFASGLSLEQLISIGDSYRNSYIYQSYLSLEGSAS